LATPPDLAASLSSAADLRYADSRGRGDDEPAPRF